MAVNDDLNVTLIGHVSPPRNRRHWAGALLGIVSAVLLIGGMVHVSGIAKVDVDGKQLRRRGTLTSGPLSTAEAAAPSHERSIIGAASYHGANGDSVLCFNDCKDIYGNLYVHDGWCSDGGPGSKSRKCALGHDCADCGPRTGSEVPGCEDSCFVAKNGRCDEPQLCGYGTDCTDCGAGYRRDPHACDSCTSPKLQPGERCSTALDGMCSIPDGRYFCANSSGDFRVSSC